MKTLEYQRDLFLDPGRVRSGHRELVVDNFAGGGGASTGIASALVRANYREVVTEVIGVTA